MKCSDCVHWGKETNNYSSFGPIFGSCDLSLETSWDDNWRKKHDRIVHKKSGDDWYSELYTGKDFGCIHFKKKE